MNLTISTMGITLIARSTETPYSVRPMGVKSKMFARKGISMIAVVKTNERSIAPQRSLL